MGVPGGGRRANGPARNPKGQAMIRLPLLFRRPANPLWYGVMWAPYIAAYQLSNRFPLAEPRELALGSLDLAIPFVPELLPLYVAYIPFYWWTVATSRDDAELGRVFYFTHFQMLLCLPLFLLAPVHFPRDLYYTAATTGWADAFWRWFDGPGNCLPSLHAANCLLLAHLYRERGEAAWKARLHTAVAAAIVASTVLVKQHYIVDLLAGAVVYLATGWVLGRVTVVETAAIGAAPSSAGHGSLRTFCGRGAPGGGVTGHRPRLAIGRPMRRKPPRPSG